MDNPTGQSPPPDDFLKSPPVAGPEDPKKEVEESEPPNYWRVAFLILLVLATGAYVWFTRPAFSPPVSYPNVPGFPPSFTASPAVDKMIAEIKSGLPSPLEQDLVIGPSDEIRVRDTRFVVTHPPSQYYLEKVSGLLGQSSKAKLPFSVRIKIQDDRFTGRGPEALALSHGAIFFGVSFFFRAQNEAELAAVLAHEISHLALRHHAQARLIQKNVARLTNQFLKTGKRDQYIVLQEAILRIEGFFPAYPSWEEEFQLAAD